MSIRTVSVSRDTLNAVMEFDHVIRVNTDGTVSDNVDGVWAPEVWIHSESDPNGAPIVSSMHNMPEPWSLVSGYSSQWQYSGPIMHASEYIGGGMADDILSRPGLWAVVTVTDADTDSESGDDDLVGWAVAHVPADE